MITICNCIIIVNVPLQTSSLAMNDKRDVSENSIVHLPLMSLVWYTFQELHFQYDEIIDILNQSSYFQWIAKWILHSLHETCLTLEQNKKYRTCPQFLNIG